MRALLLVVAAATIAACARQPRAPAPADAAHQEEIEAWRTRRDARLRGEDGWLTLVGLHWLDEGENRFLPDPSAHALRPVMAESEGGFALVRDGERVTLSAAPEAGLLHDGQPVTQLDLRSDAQGSPTVVAAGPFRFFVIARRDRLGVRVRDTQSPVRLGFTGIDNYPIDGRFRVRARLEPYTPPKEIPIPNILGGVDPEVAPGALAFELDGREYRLDPILEEGSEELFVIFGDATNGGETYGAGRFVYAPMPGPDGVTVLDFNKAYNPPCVFTPYATCPLPPPQNRLPIAVTAGEKMYGAPH
jgi:uncharacterized protein (DUF1684 family)